MIDVVCPFDLKTIKQIPLKSWDDAQKMLEKAKRLYNNRDNWLPAYERIAILKRLASLVEKEAEDLALLIATEGGKPLIDAKVEVARAIDGIQLAAKELSHVLRGEEIPMGLTAATDRRRAHTHYEPIGVVLALSAFNHPLNLIVHQVIPAVAVGCPVIVKPASATPLSCLRLCELLTEAGLPEGWCQPIICNNETASNLASSNLINFLTFIGSGRIGWMLKSKLAPGVRCALEHGGVAPVVVDKTANVEKMIPSLVKGGFYHAGQVCVSVQRVYAPNATAKEIAVNIAEQASQLKVGDARLADTEVGPLIQPKEVDRVDEWVKEAVASGAELLCGGEKLSATTYAPTVLFNPSPESSVSQKEVFGPVVCVYSYESVDEAIARANSLEVAFQAAVFSEDVQSANNIAEQLDASAVMINDHTAFRADWMPFAGRRASGYGIGGIGYTMHDMVQHKMIVQNFS